MSAEYWFAFFVTLAMCVAIFYLVLDRDHGSRTSGQIRMLRRRQGTKNVIVLLILAAFSGIALLFPPPGYAQS